MVRMNNRRVVAEPTAAVGRIDLSLGLHEPVSQGDSTFHQSAFVLILELGMVI